MLVVVELLLLQLQSELFSEPVCPQEQLLLLHMLSRHPRVWVVVADADGGSCCSAVSPGSGCCWDWGMSEIACSTAQQFLGRSADSSSPRNGDDSDVTVVGAVAVAAATAAADQIC